CSHRQIEEWQSALSAGIKKSLEPHGLRCEISPRKLLMNQHRSSTLTASIFFKLSSVFIWGCRVKDCKLKQ
ncbi:MAG: hypothetical protein OEY29_15545, partial [Gammaproteobacteria bacterium]|nr:hypothetical protein [Gammaproteobacteria bacterium]